MAVSKSIQQARKEKGGGLYTGQLKTFSIHCRTSSHLRDQKGGG